VRIDFCETEKAAALDACEQAVELGLTDKKIWFSAPELQWLVGDKRFTSLIADTFGNGATEGLADKLRSGHPPRPGPIPNSGG
jgi:hypothetical protein